MRDRPSVNADDPDPHPQMARLGITAMTFGALLGRSVPFKIGRGQIQRPIDLQREQIA
jgi:hypothetical protein